MLFYATPILYSPDVFANSKLSFIFDFNPMAIIINGYRDILYAKTSPNVSSLMFVLIGSIILLLIGVKIFKKLQKGFAEEV